MRPSQGIFLEVVRQFIQCRRVVGVADFQARPAVSGDALRLQEGVEIVGLAGFHEDVLENVMEVEIFLAKEFDGERKAGRMELCAVPPDSQVV